MLLIGLTYQLITLPNPVRMEASELLAEQAHCRYHHHLARVDQLAHDKQRINNELIAAHPDLAQKLVVVIETGHIPQVGNLLDQYRTPQQQALMITIRRSIRSHVKRASTLAANPQVQAAHQACLDMKAPVR